MSHPPTPCDTATDWQYDVGSVHHLVSNALASYCAAVDDRDSDRVGRLLGHTKVTFRGRDVDGGKTAAFYADAFTATRHPTTHVFTNLIVQPHETDPDQVSYHATYQRWEHAGTDPACVALGTYDGAFRRDRGTAHHNDAATDAAHWLWTSHRINTLPATSTRPQQPQHL